MPDLPTAIITASVVVPLALTPIAYYMSKVLRKGRDKQREVMLEQNSLLKQQVDGLRNQNGILRDQNNHLARIADTLESKKKAGKQ